MIVSVGGRGVNVNVASGVGLAGGIKMVGVSVAAAIAVPGIPVSVIVSGCASAGLSTQAGSVSKVNKRI